ncbi:MAG TPA: glycosyltransferase family protein [Polyangiaceae bacterium]|nr:glycosyltransferase family protein [Polyangiaceae bacterium]
MSRTIAIIQARVGSSRLPSKVLADIGGRTMLDRVVARVRRARRIDEVVVATTSQPADDAVAEECERIRAPTFRGSEQDVLDRYYKAAAAFEAGSVVRITSDCPLIDPGVVDQVVAEFVMSGSDYASNSLVASYPRGLDTEVMTMSALSTAWSLATQPYERVHVTPYLYQHPARFRLRNVAYEEDLSTHRWTVDTPDDLALVRRIYERLGNRVDVVWTDALAVVRGDPAISALNAHVRQKALEEG